MFTFWWLQCFTLFGVPLQKDAMIACAANWPMPKRQVAASIKGPVIVLREVTQLLIRVGMDKQNKQVAARSKLYYELVLCPTTALMRRLYESHVMIHFTPLI